jgi:UDP-glucose 4-epimerase
MIENLAYGEPKTVFEIINKFKEVNLVNFDVVSKPRRDGDAESMFLKHPSIYMERNYTYDQLLVI